MKKCCAFPKTLAWLMLLLGWVSSLCAQTTLPVIKANSSEVSIRDGSYFYQNNWTLAPEAKPDIYTADRSRKPKWVVFYTDLDSIKTMVKPGSTFDFVVVLQGKDSCYTRISSAIPVEASIQQPKKTIETIPFTLSNKNAIHVTAIVNDRDTLNLHLDIGSFDFRITQEAILKRTQLLANQPEALAGRSKPNFNKMERVRKMQLGSMVWTDPSVLPTLLTSNGMDGRFGWNLFEGKILEIDYDQNLLRIHPKLPKKLRGYKKSNLEFLQSFVCMNGTLLVKGKAFEGFFLLDTGSDQALILDSMWVAKQHFPSDLPLVKTTVFSDPRGVKYESKTVLCPKMTLNSFVLEDIPASLLGSKNPVRFEVNYLGNDVLKRFNTILDFANDKIYLKPNKLSALPYLSAKGK